MTCSALPCLYVVEVNGPVPRTMYATADFIDSLTFPSSRAQAHKSATQGGNSVPETEVCNYNDVHPIMRTHARTRLSGDGNLRIDSAQRVHSIPPFHLFIYQLPHPGTRR